MKAYREVLATGRNATANEMTHDNAVHPPERRVAVADVIAARRVLGFVADAKPDQTRNAGHRKGLIEANRSVGSTGIIADYTLILDRVSDLVAQDENLRGEASHIAQRPFDIVRIPSVVLNKRRLPGC